MVDVSISQYLGKFHNGILCSVSIIIDTIYYDAIFFYTNEDVVLTLSEELEQIMGNGPIHENELYKEILSGLIQKKIPYSQISTMVDEFDATKWVIALSEIYEGG
jgi:hypothetical protein